ncbi:MAG: Asp-tRNA(Asn)/Glu-tRNA(Gln) amidotransferase subunit GatB, partial [Candidatus Parcubacteria bacterium]|nr:Asp-tRNA(Asn)/Glu-tRNA(Gln) amidotransferase subunit GatB [Candidatus Parcubacteria bacterium]
KEVLLEMFKTGADPSNIIEGKDLTMITDEVEIKNIVKEVISQNPAAVADFKKGKQNSLQFLVGQVMAKSKGKAKPELVQKLLIEALTG